MTKIYYYMFRSLILTIIMEVFLSLILGIRNRKNIINIILVNIITNPLVTSITTFCIFFYGKTVYKYSLLSLELFAFVFEGYIYKKFETSKKINGYLLSLILNLFSYTLGFFINKYI